MFKTKTFIFTILFLAIAIYTISEEPAAPVIDSKKLEGAREFYNLGLSAFSDKQYEKARDFFLKAISYYEDFAEAYAKLGDTYIMLKDEEIGYENYKKCIEIIDKTNVPDNEMAKLSEELKRKTEKFSALEEKISILDNDFIAKLMNLGSQCLNDNDYLMAEELFSLVLRLEENNDEASDCLQKAKDNLKEETTEEPTAEDNELANAYYQSGLVLIKQNKYDEAIEKFNKAISCRRDFPRALFKLGECSEKIKDNFMGIRNYRLCLRCLQKQVNRSKEENELLTQVSQALEKIDTYNKQFKGLKNDYFTNILMVVRDCLNKKWQRFACNQLDKILQIDPEHKAALELKGKLDRSIILATEKEKSTGRITNLFNGKDLSNWEVLGAQKGWSVEKGRLIARSIGSKDTFMLWKEKRPENFTIQLDFEVKEFTEDVQTVILGVMYLKDPQDANKVDGFLFYGKDIIIGRNTAKVIIKDGKFISILNNEKKGDGYTNTNTTGIPVLGLMVRNMNLHFNSVTFQGGDSGKEIPADKTPVAKKDSSNDMPQPLFNGKNLNNWTFPSGSDSRNCCTVEKGRLVIRSNPGYDIVMLWEGDRPDDYVVKLEFELTKIIGPADEARLMIISGMFLNDRTKNHTYIINPNRLNSGNNTVKLVVKDGKYRLFVNDISAKESNINEKGIPALGLCVRNLNLACKSITLQRNDTTTKNDK